MTDAPVEKNALLNQEDLRWTETAINQKAESKKKAFVVIIALILILGTAGLILGLVLSADDGQQKD